MAAQLESSVFNVHPKVLTEGQNKAMLVLESPQTSKSDFRVAMEGVQCAVNVTFINPFNLSVLLPSKLHRLHQKLFETISKCFFEKLVKTVDFLRFLRWVFLRISVDPASTVC